MDALEKYYSEYLMGYAQDSNVWGYDADEQMTKDRIEDILVKGYMDDEDVIFIKSMLPDIEDEQIRKEIAEYVERLVIL